ncbi:MAG: ferrous iron transport protein B [Sedimentisphaeraceae bacterium JB056]
MNKKITIAFAGNPNSGKTTLFNALTGARQQVGNYPGVTVEKKEGKLNYKDYEIKIVDLPGIYSLTAYSIEEIVSRDFIIKNKPDLVVNIIDSSNIERNLYLTTQLIEMKVPLLLAFNMYDVAKNRGLTFDTRQLSRFLNAPIVNTVGSKGQGLDELLESIVDMIDKQGGSPLCMLNYGSEIEGRITEIAAAIEASCKDIVISPRWMAIKLLEQDSEIVKLNIPEAVRKEVDLGLKHIKKVYGDDAEILIADRRYGFISGACEETVHNTVERRHDISDMVDTFILNKVFGLPIFLLLMYVTFKLTFWAGEPFMGGIELLFSWLANLISGFWPAGSDSVLRSLIIDGIIGGVGGVIVFLPNIMFLFLAISVLEDTGYMARAAFVMDRIMHKIGLHGKSFIPMLIGFGCSVPAIMATRILENRRNRLTTMMVVPLMSCGARFPIYALIIPAFFPAKLHGLMMCLIYFIGILLAIVCAFLLRKTVFKGETVPFVMELPPYRMPTVKGLLLHVWERSWLYLKKAGTVILGISIVLWALSSYPKLPEQKAQGLTAEQLNSKELEYSIAGKIGNAMEPVIKPIGFDSRIGTALIGALAAKEVFVAQMGIVFSLGEADEGSEALRKKLKEAYTPLQGFCVMLFCLISAPCVGTVAVCMRESGSWKWALFQFSMLTFVAYVITFAVYQIGTAIWY